MQMDRRVYGLVAILLSLALVITPVQAAPPVQTDVGQQVAVKGNSHGATGCVACHGEDGAGQSASAYPRLAGLPEPYLIAQLQAFRSRTRQNTVMERIAGALTEHEMEQVAAFYAGLPVPDTSEPVTDAKLRLLGEKLALFGNWDKDVPACVRCHGKNGQGVPPLFPRLAGQHANYLENTLHGWQDDKRHSDPVGLMQAIAERLDDREIKAVTAYFASIAPASPAAAGSERSAQLEYNGRDQEKDFGSELMNWLNSSGDKLKQPEEMRIPKDEFGKMILSGKRIFVETQVYARQYIGNGLNCVNCHLDRGRRTQSAPMGAAYIKYPQYRAKNKKVNTIEERIQGCFRYSENGKAPPPLSDEMKGLVSYFYFLSTDLPSGKKLNVAGYPKIDKPPKTADLQRGAAVFAMNCAICHGANGEGTRLGEHYQFPPLWGKESFNWGAGMHRVNTAAAFIRGNMPLGHPSILSLQEVWDVAAYINSHERPQDPRYQGDLAATRQQYHDHQCYYGKKPWSDQLGGLFN